MNIFLRSKKKLECLRNELKKISNIILEKIDIPTKIGNKNIIKTAHKADIVRMNKLYEKGGIDHQRLIDFLGTFIKNIKNKLT